MKVPQKLHNEYEAARYIGTSVSFLRQRRHKGVRRNLTPGPAFIKVGRHVKYQLDDLDKWIAQNRCTVGATSDAA